MAAKIKNYQTRLAKLEARRRDDSYLQKGLFSESFKRRDLGETTKYVYESMTPIDRDYTQKTYRDAERVQNQISKATAGKIDIQYQYQGSVPLDTHIRTHSDLDILVLHHGFVSLAPGLPNSIPYVGNPTADLKELREIIVARLSSSFPEVTVNDEGAKAISLQGGSLSRKFDIITCNWYNTEEYAKTYDVNTRGIMIYDKHSNTRLGADYPFRHIQAVASKDDHFYVSGKYRSIIRLLKTLKVDADDEIKLSSFVITSAMYHMDNISYYEPSHSPKILVNASQHLSRLINDESYRVSLDSPNKEEKIFKKGDASTVQMLKNLKKELDEVIIDLAQEVGSTRTFSLNENLADSFGILSKAQITY
jgi:hypothetical protein